MSRYGNYLAAILLHLAILFGLSWTAVKLLPPKLEKKYIEVTLTAEVPTPVPTPPAPQPSVNAGPAKDPGTPAAGPRVDDLPPPVSKITPEYSPPAPSPVPPVPKNPASAAPPTLPTPSPDAPAEAVGPVTPNQNAPPDSGTGTGPSSGPASGTGKGGGAARWGIGGVGNGHYYEVVYRPEGVTWTEAYQYALDHGGYLATLTSKEENAFVYSLVSDPKFWEYKESGQYAGPWFGGCNLYNTWQWLNDEGSLRYSNWFPTEPEEKPFGNRTYGLHFYTEDLPDIARTPPPKTAVAMQGANPIPRPPPVLKPNPVTRGGARRSPGTPMPPNQNPGPQLDPNLPKIKGSAKPGPTWDVAPVGTLLLGFIVEYNSEPAQSLQNQEPGRAIFSPGLPF